MRTLALCVAAAVLLVTAPVQAEDVGARLWEGHLAVSDGNSRGRLSFGVRDDATTGYDPWHEVRALFGSGLRAYFWRPSWPGAYFSRDIRGPTYPDAFEELQVTGVAVGRAVTVTWDLRFVPHGCEHVRLFLLDHTTGARIDLDAARSYTYVQTASVHTFAIAADLESEPRPNAPEMSWARSPGRSGKLLVHWRPPTSGEAVAGYYVYAQNGSRARRVNDEPVVETLLVARTGATDLGSQFFVRALSYTGCEGPASTGVNLSSPPGRGPPPK